MSRLDTVLFDLDGTLVDTAPDLVYALNLLRGECGLESLAFDAVRPVVSHGAAAMLALGFPHADRAALDGLRERFLALYADNLVRESAPFPGITDVLDRLERDGLRWGVVTNKPGWLTQPLLESLGLHDRAACVVSGDTLEVRKPDPAPLLHGCRLVGSEPGRSAYVGDAERDIEAGRRGGLHTVVALFGYIGSRETPADWGADALIETPAALLDWVASPARHRSAG